MTPKARITREQVADIFRRAGAPEPSAENLPYIAATMTNIAAHYRPEASLKRTPQHRAQAAVDELRRVLPRIIEKETTGITELRRFQQSQESHANNVIEDKLLSQIIIQRLGGILADREATLAGYRQLFDSLCDFDLPPDRIKGSTLWHEDAKILFDIYQSVVGGRVGASRNGPAVKFVLAALRVCDAPVGMITGSAVAKALTSPKRTR